MENPLNDEEVSCLYGSLRLLLHNQRSGIIRSLAGDAGFDLGLIPDGHTHGGIQRAPILSAIDGQWNTWDQERKRRTVAKLAESLADCAGIVTVNAQILKHGFKFENGGFVPVNASGEIPE
jgi:hypothetical protein